MPSNRAIRETWRLTSHIIQVLFASHLFLTYGYELGPCHGPSMLPTLNHSGDYMVVEKWTHLSKRGYLAGDIVMTRNPIENYPICKRIIGKGGDVIRTDPLTGRLVKIPKGHVWLQGDNMANSNDSRDYGAVPEAILKGRVLARISFLNRPFFERLPNGFKDVSEDKSEES